MKVLFLGSIIRPEDTTSYLGPSVAGNKMQLGLLKGLNKIFKDDLTVISQIPIASYPREKKILVGSGKYHIQGYLHMKRVPFINILILKQISKIINTFIMILKWCVINKNDKKIIISYNAFSEAAVPILWAKYFCKVQAIPLLADLPVSNMLDKSKVKRVFRSIDNSLTKKNIKKFDGLAVLNKYAVEEFSPASKYVVIDGGYDLDEVKNQINQQNYNNRDKEELICIYSGVLVEYNGLKNLIEASKLVSNKNFRLHIYGKGYLENYIKDEAKNDNRIEYKGLVSGEEILNLQKNAYLLISPLLPEHPVARVAFPSKIVEYMASGTPVISTRVNGLSKDYLEHVYLFDDITPESMSKTIDTILNYDVNELEKKGINAKDFILKHKNWDKQCKKIQKFISEIIK